MTLTDLITHLRASNLFNGWAFTDWRDDASYPFSNDMNVCLIRIQGGNQDKDIGQVGVDIYLHTKKNATNSDRGALVTLAGSLDEYLITSTEFENVQHIEVNSSYAGPFKDGQDRYLTAHRITLRRSGV